MQYGKYTFRLRLERDTSLPYYKGSTFRGLFGHALKKTVCALKRQDCPACVLRPACTYALVFETAAALPPLNKARVSAPPHPVVLEPPLTGQQEFLAGDVLDCSLILFGTVNRNLPYFIYAFDQMGKIGLGKKIKGCRAGFSLETVLYDDQVIYNCREAVIHGPEKLNRLDLISDNPESQDRVRIKMLTPLRIPGKQNLAPELDFSVLFRAMIRRTTALLNTWGDGEPDLDYSGLTQKAHTIRTSDACLTWFDWQRYSARQDKKMFMGGLMGEIEYQGDLTPFMPFLRMARIVHLGKNTAFGLGKITIS